MTKVPLDNAYIGRILLGLRIVVEFEIMIPDAPSAQNIATSLKQESESGQDTLGPTFVSKVNARILIEPFPLGLIAAETKLIARI